MNLWEETPLPEASRRLVTRWGRVLRGIVLAPVFSPRAAPGFAAAPTDCSAASPAAESGATRAAAFIVAVRSPDRQQVLADAGFEPAG